MTHAECQELLLDLAYGELDAPRSAEAELHLAGCAECRKERELLERTRRVAAPLREEEELPAGFDERILAAARAEASLRADGTPGPVIEVTATKRAAGIEAAHIDPLSAVVPAAPRAPRRKWATRLAVGGSAAAAAALALAVSSSLRAPQPQPQSEHFAKEYAIRVRTPEPAAQPPSAPASGSTAPAAGATAPPSEATAPASGATAPASEATAPASGATAPVSGAHAPPSAATAPGSEARRAAAPPPAAAPPAARRDAAPAEEAGPGRAAARALRSEEGGGGDVSASAAERSAASAGPAGLGAMRAKAQAVRAREAEEPAAKRSRSDDLAFQSAPAEAQPAPAEPESQTVGALARQSPAPQKPAAAAPSGELAPEVLEQSAQKARRDGNYALAAALYRKAAAQHAASKPEPQVAAWDLAHAVECLSAISQFDEARKVADELSRLYPGEAGAASATRRALRSVQVAPSDSAAPDR